MEDAALCFRDAPEKYWNFQTLCKIPAYRPSPFADSRCEGLEDILVSGAACDGRPAEFFACIGYPDGPVPEGGFPGIVLIHGGGGTVFPEYVKLWMERGFAVIALDWYNQRPQIKEGGTEVIGQIPLCGGRRQNHVVNVANMILAHSLLRSLEMVNPEKTAFVGLSWGSWYGAMVAAVDSRFQCGIEIYCGDVRRYSRPDPVDEFVNGRFHHAAKIPMYWVAGTNDQNVTMHSLRDGFRECGNLYNHSLVIDLPHGHLGFSFEACFRIADHFLKGGVSLPKLGQASVADGRISSPVEDFGKGAVKAVLCYTDLLDENGRIADRWFKRVWKESRAEINDGMVCAEIPAGARQCFLSLYDEEDEFRTCCGSTEMTELDSDCRIL